MQRIESLRRTRFLIANRRPGAILSLAWLALSAVACETPEGAGTQPRDASPVQAPAPRRLAPGQVAEGELLDEEVRTFFLELPAEHYLWITADGRQIDLGVALTGPRGESLATLEVAGWWWRPEAIAAVTREAGRHELVVRGGDGEQAAGRYRIELVELRPAEALDRARVSAQVRYGRALELSEENVPESSRRALEGLEEALRLWRRVEDAEREAAVRYWIGVVQNDLGRRADAARSFEQSLAARRVLGDPGAIAEALYRLGRMRSLEGRYAQALALDEEALALAREAGVRELAAFTLNNLGVVHYRLADLQASLDRYRQALALFRELGMRKWQALTLNNLGSGYQNLGDIDRSVEYFAQALPIFRELGEHSYEATTLNNLGWGHKARGEVRRSLPLFEEALRLAEELDDDRLRSLLLDNLARAHLELGDPQAALAAARAAHELSVAVGDPRAQAVRLISVGMAHHALGDTEAALERFTAALAICRKLGNRRNEAMALLGLARALRAQGETETAQRHLAAALEIVEAVRLEFGTQNLRAHYLASQRSYYELEVDLWMDLARERSGTAEQAEALTAHERARARGLLDHLTEAHIDLRAGADPALLEEEERLRAQLNSAEQRRLRLAAAPAGGELVEVKKQIRRLLDRIEDVERRLRRRNPRYAALTRPRSASLEAIQERLLDSGSLLLEYALGSERSHLFAVTREALVTFELPPRSEIDAAARRTYELLCEPDAWMSGRHRAHRSRYRQAATKLSELVLGPLGGLLEGRRLLVAPEGVLRLVPFAALPAPGRAGWHPLIEDHEVVRLPSASVLLTLREQLADRPRAPKTLAILADPVFEPGDERLEARRSADTPVHAEHEPVLRAAREAGMVHFSRLLNSRREAEAIARLVDPDTRLLALDFSASRATAIHPDLGHYRILHFATHGFLSSYDPELSGLVLSLLDRRGSPQEGFLRLHDVYRLELNAELVVLSACRTGLGKPIVGEGLVGLTRGFMHAGAPRIVASLWQVDDRATAAFMERFYRGMLHQGLSPAEALRAAQLQLHRGEAGKGWRSPYFWAPFVIHGEWRPMSG